ncbi:MAG: YceI family protein [bacterium]|nr:YceI family protein [bacterium]
MRFKSVIYSVIACAVLGAAYIAYQPGVLHIEPRIAHAAPAPISQATYSIDPMHSSIYFDIAHLGLSRINGRFNKFSGKIVEDAANVGNSSVEFTAEASSIDTGIEARDNHLRNADFFDVEKFPTLTFKSTEVRQAGAGYVLTGDLTLHGVTKQVTIPFTHHGPYTLEQQGKSVTRIGVVAEPITILRSDFGIGKTDPMPDGTMGLSNEVEVRISFEATLDAPPAA